MLDTANNLNMVMVPTGRPSDPCEEVVTISSNSAEHRSHAYGTCAKNGGQPRVRRSIGNHYYNLNYPALGLKEKNISIFFLNKQWTTRNEILT